MNSIESQDFGEFYSSLALFVSSLDIKYFMVNGVFSNDGVLIFSMYYE
jgi:hypothetical protein